MTSIKWHVARDGTASWRVRVDHGIDPVTGTRRRPMEMFRTKREAEAARAAKLVAVERGTAIDPSRLTTGAYLAHWLATSVEPNVRASTHASYASLIRTHVVPRIGAVPLQKLAPMHIQRLYGDMLAAARGDGRGGTVSPHTVRYVHAVLKKALKQAVRWRNPAHNPCEDVDPPKAARPRIAHWDTDETRRFLAAAEGDTYGAIWMAALHTGMRQGELLGLRWGDVDLDRAVAHVRRAAPNRGGEMHEPTTRAGRRTVTLGADLVAALREHRRTQMERRLRAGIWADPDLVFSTDVGTVIGAGNLSRRFHVLVRRAGVKRITCHGMRHTHATLLLLAGVDIKTISARLGHASIQITLDTYAHLMPGQGAEAAAILGRALALGG